MIPLFRLWQVVRKDFGGNDKVTGEHLWPQVAKELGFNAEMQNRAAGALEACYAEILADFETAREQYIDPTESQEQAMIEQQLLASVKEMDDVQDESPAEDVEDGEEDFDDDLNAPQASPALKTSHKRSSSERANRFHGSVPGSSSKRQRIDKGKGKQLEIPSTPEEIINVNQKPRELIGPSPLKPYDNRDKDDNEDHSFVHSFIQPDLIALKVGNNIMEPEIQDFHFTLQPVEENEDEDEGEKKENEEDSPEVLSASLTWEAVEGQPDAAMMNLDEELPILSETESIAGNRSVKFLLTSEYHSVTHRQK